LLHGAPCVYRVGRSGAEQVVNAPNRRRLLDRDHNPAYCAYLLLDRLPSGVGQCHFAPSQKNPGRQSLEPINPLNQQEGTVGDLVRRKGDLLPYLRISFFGQHRLR